MTTKMHQGVGLLISNTDKTQFFVQIKDEHYPYEAWRGACAFWGGAIETGEDALRAVERELEEEIPEAARFLKQVPKKKINYYLIDNKMVVNPFGLTVFEAIVSTEDLQKIAQTRVLEGRALLLSKSDLLERKWIWGMDFIFKTYLETVKK
ncbi:MAG: Unknown protein [uncultured Aureispira sp.]|uniref:Nudix hydrolase domain-containing protein n=1 Tax=uncultured Aureispira sp. TaxID=1331704 RepID=A0A6S6T1U8_9BACT|nr:MAG: Unknown protein [uncultured Aureispira sp.]